MKLIDPLVFDTSVIFNLGHRGMSGEIVQQLAEHHQLLIPPSVFEETQRLPRFSEFYKIFVHSYFHLQTGTVPMTLAPKFTQLVTKLGSGEFDVIILALDTGGTAVIDERIARREARELNIPVTGTLGLLENAVRLTWLTEPQALEIINRLRVNHFRLPALLAGESLADFLERLGKY